VQKLAFLGQKLAVMARYIGVFTRLRNRDMEGEVGPSLRLFGFLLQNEILQTNYVSSLKPLNLNERPSNRSVSGLVHGNQQLITVGQLRSTLI
jgi:hypothetical protein